ncbi:excinuclease ABC subunit UvrC [Rapidithrix thailandica]|uniref:UvrABC system protein C n=1 Tax=Rapidithrix thailandica TaxID=413964 RepID=A0AAW9S4Y6_9BACT
MTYQEKLRAIIEKLPKEPGVYKYLNEEDKIIYVGKAKALKNRVSSYFNKDSSLNRKTRKLVSEIRDIEYVVVDTEYDALLLENNLIKKLQPKYNILLKDDKTYPFICVTNEPFPRIFPTRNIQDKRHRYFGPYASVRIMHAILELFKDLYTLRTCQLSLTEKNIQEGKFKVCLEYHIKNCQGPCEGLQSEADYLEDIRQAVDILKGKISPVKQYFKEKMTHAAGQMDFENAQRYKEKLEALDKFQEKSLVTNPKITDTDVFTIISEENYAYINFIKIINGCINQTKSLEVKKKLGEEDVEILEQVIVDTREQYGKQSQRILTNIDSLEGIQFDVAVVKLPKIGDLKKLVELSLKNVMYFKKDRQTARLSRQNANQKNQVLIQLKNDLNLTELPKHIECFDNSNIQGTNPVASMVCFKDGKPAKKEYRHFKIKTVVGPDDFASMHEVVTRRYKRLITEQKPLPDLIVIDGGKGQLNAAYRALQELGIRKDVPVVGIAKRLEEIYYPHDQLPLHIHKKSPALALLQHLRNEAHRFAITFHRDLRSKNSLNTQLEEIPGIGTSTVQKLLTEFKSVKKLKEAAPSEIEQLIGKHKAQILLNGLKKD